MTSHQHQDARRTWLTQRLSVLEVQRREVRAEALPVGCGDDADRATNVDAHVRLAMLDQRIASIEAELAHGQVDGDRGLRDGVAVGDTITVDLGDGPEEFLFASIEHTDAGTSVITPGSPLGRALLGARIGATVEYRGATRRTLRATLLNAA